MERDDNKHEHASGHLPVTGEVGSEGGSYADATAQKATREGGVPRLEDAGNADGPEPRPGQVAGAITPSPDEPEDGVHTRSPKRH
jgi:hypothetical protein